MYIENKVTGFSYVALQVLLVLCGVWSLDFFRSVIPPFCVSSNIKNVHALALEYLAAFHPIFLIIITYVCIKLHDNNFKPVVWLWKPFHRHFVHLRRWDSKASIINAFTTFLLLSFSKTLFVSFTLLYIINIHYSSHEEKRCVMYMYYDPTVECHALKYLIVAVIAGCVLLIFTIFPIIILILYPTRLFRKCVSCRGFRRWHALHMFMESFQGQYKDGTNGTRDFRTVSALFLILGISTLASFSNHHFSFGISGLQCVLFILVLCFYAVARPYKLIFSNNVDILILALLEIFLFTIHSETYHPGSKFAYYALPATTLLLGVPHIVLISYICHKLAMKAGITQHLKRKYKRCVMAANCTSGAETNVEAESDSGSLPDRLMNPGSYEPVLLTTEEHTSSENSKPVTEDPTRLTPVYTYGSIN